MAIFLKSYPCCFCVFFFSRSKWIYTKIYGKFGAEIRFSNEDSEILVSPILAGHKGVQNPNKAFIIGTPGTLQFFILSIL